jgi:metal-responsive CopG/Arc/MetJ family transcriptional regulator
MRTLVDIPDGQLKDLAQISKASGQSRAAVIRDAIAAYIAKHRTGRMDDAFGLWGHHKIDGIEYQKKLRSEW